MYEGATIPPQVKGRGAACSAGLTGGNVLSGKRICRVGDQEASFAHCTVSDHHALNVLHALLCSRLTLSCPECVGGRTRCELTRHGFAICNRFNICTHRLRDHTIAPGTLAAIWDDGRFRRNLCSLARGLLSVGTPAPARGLRFCFFSSSSRSTPEFTRHTSICISTLASSDSRHRARARASLLPLPHPLPRLALQSTHD